MEQRILNIMFTKSGGTAGSGGITTRLTLPKKWIDEMQINKDNKQVRVSFEKNKIVIEKYEED